MVLAARRRTIQTPMVLRTRPELPGARRTGSPILWDGCVTWAYEISLACRFLVGTVFTVSLAAKLWGRAAWRSYSSWLRSLPLSPLGLKRAPAVLVGAEAAIVALAAMPASALAGLIAASVLCLALTVGLAVVVRRGSRQPCHCFGAAREPLSETHVARNALLLAAVATGCVCTIAARPPPIGIAGAALSGIGGVAAAVLFIFSGDIAALLAPTAQRQRRW